MMKKNTLFMLSLLCLTTLSMAQNKQDKDNYPKLNSLSDRLVGLSRIWSEVKYNFANIDQMEENWDSLYEAMIPQVVAAQNDVEYYELLQLFMSKCNDGHTEIVRKTYGWNQVYDYTPCLISEVDERFYITSVRKNGAMDTTLLYAEVVAVSGVPTLQYVKDSLFAGVSASTYQGRLMHATTKLMQGPIGSSRVWTVRKTDGKTVKVSIVKNGETTRAEDDQYVGISDNRPKGPIVLDWVGKLAVLQINSFRSEKVINDIDSLANLIRAQKAQGLIIDLRFNGGGSTTVAQHLQMYLTHADSIRTFGAQKRINDGYGRSQGNYRDEYKDFYLDRAYESVPSRSIKVKEGIIPFDIPVVVLVGRYTFSAAEDFLINIYECPDRPKIVGEPTGGSTGAPLMIPLPHKAMARVCTLRTTFPYSEKPFIGRGITPDLVAKPTLQDIIEGKDVVMETAVGLIKNNK